MSVILVFFLVSRNECVCNYEIMFITTQYLNISMKEPKDLAERTVYRIVLTNSPIISKDVISKGVESGINYKKVYRTLDTLIHDKWIKKRDIGSNVIYFAEKGLILRNTQSLVVESIILLERDIPKLDKLIKKNINRKGIEAIIKIFSNIDKYLSVLNKMVKWNIPEKEDVNVMSEAENKAIKKNMDILFPITKPKLKSLIKRIEESEKKYKGKLIEKDNQVFIYVHNALFNNLG